MENITLKEIYATLFFFVGFIGVFITLFSYLNKFLSKIIKKEIEPISLKIDGRLKDINENLTKVKEGLNELGINDCKNFLTVEFARLENGEQLSIEEKQWIYHNYERYINIYKQNSYIHDKFEQLKKGGLL